MINPVRVHPTDDFFIRVFKAMLGKFAGQVDPKFFNVTTTFQIALWYDPDFSDLASDAYDSPVIPLSRVHIYMRPLDSSLDRGVYMCFSYISSKVDARLRHKYMYGDKETHDVSENSDPIVVSLDLVVNNIVYQKCPVLVILSDRRVLDSFDVLLSEPMHFLQDHIYILTWIFSYSFHRERVAPMLEVLMAALEDKQILSKTINLIPYDGTRTLLLAQPALYAQRCIHSLGEFPECLWKSEEEEMHVSFYVRNSNASTFISVESITLVYTLPLLRNGPTYALVTFKNGVMYRLDMSDSDF